MEISAIRLEALKEIGNIGSGHAATSLSKLLQARIDMSVPKVWLVPLEKLGEALGEYDTVQVALYLKVEGDAPGKAIFVLPIESARVIAQKLLSLPERPDIFSDEMAQSALQEVGNILVSSFIIALSKFSGVLLHPSIPAMAIDMVGAIIDGVLLEEGIIDDDVLIIDTKLSGVKEVEGKFFFIPSKGSLDKLLGVFGI
ncbi:Chemotaxis protein CheC -- inhibitor of MCP methylation [Dehalobacter sp. UNSWDHB]|jgi:Chemotaxis protein CheC, inhibitor of MCP methylation|uniref:chemotaxis protein CheC n=1 Tax=unclassified Dehalobacter TaxID=2635733 RepID=UPI00028A4733|nr:MULTISPECIES: chemotaxis protein CheC [unclassified Dehalobacter]AFV02544.1 Chemotaxis protein CheC -- inhibitor of MCP methylation [Dehalobacter sp. DCA]AFV05533.1 Chemotaxis protein CheC -- inhibitor of MCP methylation [Dehalobacter sp. CF]EQB21768.1 Chemotaxis protein CheC -- inhibitor of MCP methylation [Dehalobacter sp. UNSWDHB]